MVQDFHDLNIPVALNYLVLYPIDGHLAVATFVTALCL